MKDEIGVLENEEILHGMELMIDQIGIFRAAYIANSESGIAMTEEEKIRLCGLMKDLSGSLIAWIEESVK
jgi:hypothetical protein